MFQKITIFLLTLILTTLAPNRNFAQSDNSLNLTRLQKDFDIAVEAIQNTHPSVTMFISKDSLESFITSSRNLIGENSNEDDLHIILRKVINKIACGHTVARPSEEWYAALDAPTLLPFDIVLVDKKFFINSSFEADSLLLPGTEIVSIGNQTTEVILSEMRSIQEKDGNIESFSNSKIEKLFRTYYLFLYGQQENYQIEYINTEGSTESISLKGGIKSKSTSKEEQIEKDSVAREIRLKTTSSELYFLKNHPKTAVLDIDAFQQKKFKKYYKKVFKEIAKNDIQNLIIDLRSNGGGYFPNGNRLLRYLVDEEFNMNFNRPKTKVKKSAHLKMNFISKMTRFLFSLMPDKDKNDPRRNFALKVKPKKKNHFDGKIFVLINGGSFSMSSYTSSMLNKYTDAIFIGEECGGGEYGSNAILDYDLTLPESGIRIRIPYYFLDHKVQTKEKGRGVMPDYPIEYSLEDRLNGKDKEMDKLISLISS